MTLKSLEEHNEERSDVRVEASNGIACPECGAELYDARPHQALTSNPLQKRTHCSGCDYAGYRRV